MRWQCSRHCSDVKIFGLTVDNLSKIFALFLLIRQASSFRLNSLSVYEPYYAERIGLPFSSNPFCAGLSLVNILYILPRSYSFRSASYCFLSALYRSAFSFMVVGFNFFTSLLSIVLFTLISLELRFLFLSLFLDSFDKLNC
mgnify:FL=1|jgi:hypothetical protein